MPGLTVCAACGLPIGEGQRPATPGMLDHIAHCEKHPLAKRIKELEDALRPFAKFRFGPGWVGHMLREQNGDTSVLCSYDADGKQTNVEVRWSDFERARNALPKE